MEKNGIKSKKELCIGLLIFAALFPQVHAKTLSKNELKNLTVKSDSEIFFTAQENGYTLLLPGIEIGNVQTDLSPLPLGVKFISSKKEEYFDDEADRGTAVHLWFTFTDAGVSKLPPLIAKINGRTYYLPFERVQIYENPNLISPVLSVEFEDESALRTDKKTGAKTYMVQTGKEIRYKVYIQYFLQILNYSWKLPKDSIFTETKRHLVTDSQSDFSAVKKEFTPQKFPLAEFSWKPLQEGNYRLPPIHIEAVAYNGSRKQISLPDFTIEVKNAPESSGKASPQNKKTDATSEVFKEAFTKNETVAAEEEKYVPTAEDCRKIAKLRSKERHSFFWKRIEDERREFEKSIGIISEDEEPHFLLTRKLSKPCGIFAGGSVSPVPEEKALSHKVSPAQHVKIIEKVGEWSYIESKGFSGWVKSQLIYEIK